MDEKKQKKVVAVSRAEYRGVQIMEDGTGYSMFIMGRKFYSETLADATNMINTIKDAMQKAQASMQVK